MATAISDRSTLPLFEGSTGSGGFHDCDPSRGLFSRPLLSEMDNSWDPDLWDLNPWDTWRVDDGDKLETMLSDIQNDHSSPHGVFQEQWIFSSEDSAWPPLAPEVQKNPETTNTTPKESLGRPLLLLKRPTKPQREPTRVQPRRAAASKEISYTEGDPNERLVGEKHPRDEESPQSSPKFAYAEGGLFSNGNAAKKTKQGKEKKKDPTRYIRGCESAVRRWKHIPDDAKEDFDDGHGSVWVCSQPIGRHLGIDSNDWAFLGVAYSLYESVILEMNAKKTPTNINHWTRFGAFLHKFFDRKRGEDKITYWRMRVEVVDKHALFQEDGTIEKMIQTCSDETRGVLVERGWIAEPVNESSA
jgi:hypothetical protein